jgi:hypothetical protein
MVAVNLLLRRHRRPSLFGGPVILGLDVRAEFSVAELASIRRHRLAGSVLYRRRELAEPGVGLIGLAYRVVFHLTNLTVRVNDLFEGRRIEGRDFVEMAAIEAQILQSAHALGEILKAADRRIPEEVVEA